MTAPDDVTRRIVDFLEAIGIPCRAGAVEEDTILPGIRAEGGTLHYDPSRMASPGDLLHEAGHLALLTPADRVAAGGNLGTDGGFEMGAMAWSWAALCHLGVEPGVVFHEQGYRGGGQELIDAFTTGPGVGVPMLDWLGLADGFPQMRRWLRA